jgi:hypothetical protein
MDYGRSEGGSEETKEKRNSKVVRKQLQRIESPVDIFIDFVSTVTPNQTLAPALRSFEASARSEGSPTSSRVIARPPGDVGPALT